MFVSTLVLLLWAFVGAQAAVIRGRLDLGGYNISQREVLRSYFSLYQVGNVTDKLYHARAKIQDEAGTFEFTDVPVSDDADTATYFALHSLSLDFNLKPNRILVEVRPSSDLDAPPTIRAYKNIFGRQNFPSPDILHPEKLEEIPASPAIVISTVNSAPLRLYVETRNQGIFQKGPLASIVNSKYKLAAVITVIMLLLFPVVLEKLDPETAKAIREQKVNQQKGHHAENPAASEIIGKESKQK
ncbi:LAMI_0G07800g1_1 [Lachancea mirantina]|uniref:Protein SOP4 n=1 Tax=Lachancea mirantina TaxID=1230905 RepID=A0A1G4K9R9_9SACH|nr:LAMI_0G07800g1_1 [Lachancea mirantina]